MANNRMGSNKLLPNNNHKIVTGDLPHARLCSGNADNGGGLVASVMSDSVRLHGLQPAKLFCLWNSLGKNTGVGCHFLRQGIFPT